MIILANVLRRALTSRCTRRRLIVIAPKRAHGILSAIPLERKKVDTKGRVRLVAHLALASVGSNPYSQFGQKPKLCTLPISYGRT